ncbi:MAG: DUF6152 family protein [Candidatus Rariloculaceae bacterium]
MRLIRLQGFFLVVLFSLYLDGVSAHHSVAYYGDEIVQFSGEIVGVEWRNPHVRLSVRSVNESGVAETWEMEGNSLYNLRRARITAEQFPVGLPVVVTGNRSTRDEFMLLLESLELADGTEYMFWDLNGRVQVAEEVVDAAAENKGIFRVWSVPRANIGSYLQQLQDQPFTEAAVAARVSWNPLDNFATRCEPEGMPRIMVNPHPFEFIDGGSEITLRTELYDIVRTIHMDVSVPPDDEPWSRLGYSVGQWQDGDLIVTTTRVNWPYFDNFGTPQTEDVEIVERFALSDDQTRLDVEVTVTDPETFSSPARLTPYWLALGDSIPPYDCKPLEL